MYEELLTLLQAKSYKLAAAESCTGGLVSAAITDIAGISQVYAGSITAYENSVKMNLLQVPESVLLQHGAVSEECAQAMALGAARALQSQVAVSTTGIAGPTGGTPDKPVGTVFVAVSCDGGEEVRELHIGNGLQPREYVRYVSASNALDLARRMIG